MSGPGPAELLEHAKDAAVTTDEDAVVQYANKRIEECLDCEPEQIVDRDLLEIFHPEDRVDVEKTLEKVESSSESLPADLTTRVMTPEGETVWIETRIGTAEPLEDSEYVFWLRGDGQKARPDDQLKLHQELFEATEDFLWMFNADWDELLLAVGTLQEEWGISIEELREEPTAFLEQVFPPHREDVILAMERLSSGESVDLRYRVNEENDYNVWVWVRAIPLFEDGEVTRIAGLSRDITELQNRNLQTRVIDRLIRHQMRNRLTVILGHCELLYDVADPAIVDTIVESSYTLLNLQTKFGEILEIVVEKNSSHDFELVELTRKLAQTIEEDFPEAEITLDLPPQAHVEAIHQLPKAIHELLTNAVEHAPPGEASMEVSIKTLDKHVQLSVADVNPPIPSAEIDILTGRADVSEVKHGTGLGLWLVKWIVEQSDGRFNYQTREHQGNILELTLPKIPEVELEELEATTM